MRLSYSSQEFDLKYYSYVFTPVSGHIELNQNNHHHNDKRKYPLLVGRLFVRLLSLVGLWVYYIDPS